MKQQLTVNVSRLNEIAAFSEWKNFRAELSLRANVSTSLVNQMFCGRSPGIMSRLRICRALNVEMNDLFTDQETAKEVA